MYEDKQISGAAGSDATGPAPEIGSPGVADGLTNQGAPGAGDNAAIFISEVIKAPPAPVVAPAIPDWMLTEQTIDEAEALKARVRDSMAINDATINPNPEALIKDPLEYLQALEHEEATAAAPVTELIYLRRLDKRPTAPNLIFAIPQPIPPALMMPIINSMSEGADEGEQAFSATLKFCRKLVRVMKPGPNPGELIPIEVPRPGWVRLFNAHPILHTYLSNRFTALMLECMGVPIDVLGEGLKPPLAG